MSGSRAASRQRPDARRRTCGWRRRDPPGRRALLDRLRDAGVAAYSAPSLGRRGPYSDTVPPSSAERPASTSTRAARAGPRRRRRATCARSHDELAWPDIVAGFDAGPTRRRGAALAGQRGRRRRTRGAEAARPATARRTAATVGRATLPAAPRRSPAPPRRRRSTADDHFEPPPPPPLPAIDRRRAVRLGRRRSAGRLFLVLRRAARAARSTGWVGLLALVGVRGRLRHARRPDEGPPADDDRPDDGAVV